MTRADEATPPPWTCQALIFDVDGTLVDSAETIERHTRMWATRNGLDADDVLERSHGLRDRELVAALVPPHAVEAEVGWLHEISCRDVAGIRAMSGAGSFLASVPPGRWAVVTSGADEVARRRLHAAGLPVPEVFITAEDVQAGKPHPDGYLLAAARLGVDPGACLVFEDSAVGVQSGLAAGMQVIVVSAHDTVGELVVDGFGELNLESVSSAEGPMLRVGRLQHVAGLPGRAWPKGGANHDAGGGLYCGASG